MTYQPFTRIALAVDLPKHRLRAGDVGTIVESHAGLPGQEPGYTLEIFNALGKTIAVPTVRESQIELLDGGEVLHVRRLEAAVA
jgi:hypothetical protein